MSKIGIGQKVICTESGVIGTVLRFYCPTACEEQTLVQTEDGRRYHAPTRTWVPYLDGLKPTITIWDESNIMSKNPSITLNMTTPNLRENISIYRETVEKEVRKKLYYNFDVENNKR
jgi:hypothetical protein